MSVSVKSLRGLCASFFPVISGKPSLAVGLFSFVVPFLSLNCVFAQPDFSAAEAWGEEMKALVTARRGEARALRREERLKIEEEAKAALAIEAPAPATATQQGDTAARTGEDASASSPSAPSAGGEAGTASSGMKTEIDDAENAAIAAEETPAKKTKTATADEIASAASVAAEDVETATPPSLSSPPPPPRAIAKGGTLTKREAAVSDEEREGKGDSGTVLTITAEDAAPAADVMDTETKQEVADEPSKAETLNSPTRAAGGTSDISEAVHAGGGGGGGGVESSGRGTTGANKREREVETGGEGGGTAGALRDGRGGGGTGEEGQDEHRAAKR